MTKRIELSQPLTTAEEHAVALMSRGLNYEEIAETLGVVKRTVEAHISHAAAKIPGELPPKLRVVAWYRGGKTYNLPSQEDA